MNKSCKFNSLKEIEDYADKNSKVLVVFDEYVLDATSFAAHHPGGAGLILNYSSKDITHEMESHLSLSLVMANSMVIGTIKKDIKRTIDPDQPLLRQIWKMDHQSYLKIIDSPHWLFVESPRMFETDFFERFSHNKWYYILFFPLLVVLNYALMVDWSGMNIFFCLGVLLIGFFSFTLAEYLIHRFIFHSEKYLFDNRVLRYLHFIMHGIHHMLPVDPQACIYYRDRIVYPPALAVITIFIGYCTVYQIVGFANPQLNCFYWFGFLLGYFSYDLTHYSLHFTDTSKNKGTYFHRLQRYHNQHHFGGDQLGFGVSSKLWDIVFRTELPKKLMH